MFGGAVEVCEARLRGVEERVCRVLPARRRRQPKRVRHELGAVVEREARVSGEAAREVGSALAGLRRVSDKSIREQWCVWVTMRILLVMFLVFVALFGESRHELGSRG